MAIGGIDFKNLEYAKAGAASGQIAGSNYQKGQNYNPTNVNGGNYEFGGLTSKKATGVTPPFGAKSIDHAISNISKMDQGSLLNPDSRDAEHGQKLYLKA